MEEGCSNLLTSAGFNACNAQLQATALTATRKAVGLPSDVGFHRSMDHSFAQDLDAFSERVLLVTNRLLNLVATVDQSQGSRGKGKEKLATQDDVVDNFHSLVVDSMDQLLEKTDICLDDVLGKNKAPAVAINPPTAAKKPTHAVKGHLEPVVHHAVHLPKPQLSFKKQPDNSDLPWYPTLTHKYNAQVPLGYAFHDSDDDIDESLVANHPYRYEITHLVYPQRMFVPCTPDLPTSLEDTQATWVATIDAFQSMLSKLKQATELAVDLEHHSYRSYSGFLCLMQISDREEDWIVNLLALRDEVESLNEVFTDPDIVKVFHGAESDIVWLQQDFNVYVVNLFDTFHASKLLANLLEMYCDFVPDKRYQWSDWRIRPLPEDMLKYARSDTHFLLYIYDNLRNALLDRSQSGSQVSTSPPLERGLLGQALARSAETLLRVYTKEPYDALGGSGQGGWDKLAKKWNKIALTAGGPRIGVGAMPREVYKLHEWREKVARKEDEGTKYVLQNHVLIHIGKCHFRSLSELIGAFRDIIIAHHEAVLKGVLHHDISINNVMIYTPNGSVEHKGLLIDFDHATVDNGSNANQNHVQSIAPGTLPFIATAILMGTKQHAPRHDLESIFYVLIYATTVFKGPESIRKNEDYDIPVLEWFEMRYSSSFRQMARLRMGLLYDFNNAILHEMDDYFRPLFPFLKNLLHAFFPDHLFADNKYDNQMTYGKMIKLFNDEYNRLKVLESKQSVQMTEREEGASGL